jgi:hypothetical protein
MKQLQNKIKLETTLFFDDVQLPLGRLDAGRNMEWFWPSVERLNDILWWIDSTEYVQVVVVLDGDDTCWPMHPPSIPAAVEHKVHKTDLNTEPSTKQFEID